MSKEIGFMTSITVATHRATATAASSSRRVSAALTAGSLIVMALLVALQLGHSTQATALPTQEQVQQDWGINQAPDPGYVRGRPH